MRILVALEPVDFRRGIDGLASICRQYLKEDPFSGTLFVFRNRSRTAIKLLIYDGHGFWLLHKRLSKGRFPLWPTGEGQKVKEIQGYELLILTWGALRGEEQWRRIEKRGVKNFA